MVGMAIGPVRHGHDARTVTADEGDGLNKVLGMFADFAIGPAQVFAPGRTKDRARRFGFSQPLVDPVPLLPISPAVRSHSPTRRPRAA